MSTKKKSSVPVRLSQYNRVQATVRNAQYLKDYRYIEKLKSRLKKVVPLGDILKKIGVKIGDRVPMDKLDEETKASLRYHFERQRVESKWQLNYLLAPQKAMQLRGELYGFIYPDIVNVIPNKIGKIRKGWVRFPEDFIPHLKERRYLTLQIDLTERKGKILEIVKEKIDFYSRLVIKFQKEHREGETSLNPWQVYNMHCPRDGTRGKSLLKIAKEMFGFKDNPAYNSKAKAKYEQVVAAYKKAVKMIEQVTPII